MRLSSSSKKPILRYLVDRRPEFHGFSPQEILSQHWGYLHSPFSLPDLPSALELLLASADSGDRILLFGDRDADGVTSTALLGNFLRKHPRFQKAEILIENSTDSDPYGLSKPVMDKILKANPKLLITLDFGSSQSKEIQELQNLGIKVIVLDHHEVPTEIVPGSFCINPRRLDSEYPEKKICTAVLSFKIIQAILFRLSNEFNLLYRLEDTRGTFFYRNGIQLDPKKLTSTETAQSLSFPSFAPLSEPVTEESRRIFFFQASRIPGFLDELSLHCDLAGIGTITDMMPLVGENRIILKNSLQSLQKLVTSDSGIARLGLFYLLKELQFSPRSFTAKDLGWTIGPALNAAGRMGQTQVAVSLLLSEDPSQATLLAKRLIHLNSERKERTTRNLDRVQRYFARDLERKNHAIAFCYEPDMEPGVSGIVATKMAEEHQKTAIFISPDHGEARGSIRAFQKENVLEILSRVSEHLLHFGGHPEAGGFSVAISKIPDLEKSLHQVFDVPGISSLQTIEETKSSDFLVTPEEINESLAKEWKDLEPFGQGNPEILLGIQGTRVIHLNPLSGGKHLRFQLIGCKLKFLLWNQGEAFQKFISGNDKIDLIGKLEKNYFQGRESLQFVVEWFGIAKPP